MRLLEKLESQSPLVLDGGLATTLEQAGCNLNSSLWSSEVLKNNPVKIKEAHQSFTDAGADILLTSTYQASYQTFSDIGLKNVEIEQLFTTAVDQIMDSSTATQVIVGSLGPYGAYLSDGSEYTGDYQLSNKDYFEFHRARIDALITRGIHDFVFETVPNFDEVKAIIEYIVPHYKDQTFWLSVTVDDSGDLSDGTKFEYLCEFIKNYKKEIPVFGINCSSVEGIKQAIVKGLADLPQTIALYPNGGAKYNAETKQWESMGDSHLIIERIPDWLKHNVKIIGGCCQTTPEDIENIHNKLNLSV
ncbi:homocysteine S-methyltransferase [Staphylococcus xylosus]|uniref:homocysteine S-methyltransferase n=1 Tax=Staphylococcus xylosus TaxID=1288 RepID=UPI00049AEE96|nr:homocysteine S-methyltransferase [Staphylococcus xylosus]AID43602.1 Homocysteine S-methyltransferase [Staphylococcus xylosus]RIM83457.1 homocysteine S-methyltransferase [Staphylococcus xylosus]WRY39835.1 homocysteine S-methyltransferase [Staphylococcus xylosus]